MRIPSGPAFYDFATRRREPLVFGAAYDRFIDIVRGPHGVLFFSAREKFKKEFRVYRRDADGTETMVYQNDVGPFRFLLSPDGEYLALQVMGASVWPTIAVHHIRSGKTIGLGEGYSPEWAPNANKLLYLSIPGSLPTYLYEYDVEHSTASRLLKDSVMEAVYMESENRLLVKTSARSRVCDAFQMWDRTSDKWTEFVQAEDRKTRVCKTHQREITALPGRQFFFFKEKRSSDPEAPTYLVVVDAWGGRLVTLEPQDWEPGAMAVDDIHLVVGQDPLYLLRADGTGGRQEIPHSGFIRPGEIHD